MNLKQDISLRIKQVREHLKMTPTEFSAATNVQSQTIRDYENAKSIPGGAFLAALTELGISVEWVLTGVGYINYKFEEWPTDTPVVQLRTERRLSQATIKEAQTIDGVDYDLLLSAQQAVHEFMLEQDFVQPPERVASLVVAIYKYAVAKGVVKPAELKSFLKLVA